MEKDRDFKIITIVALILAIVSLTLGFSAYTMDIKYTPEKVDTKVEISEGLNYVQNSTEVVYSAGKTSAGEIINDVWTGINFAITGPGSSASVKAKIKNVSSYDVYLYSLLSDKSIVCEITDKSQNYESSYIKEACEDIYLKMEINNIAFRYGSDSKLNYYPGNVLIEKGNEIDVVLTLVYPKETIKPLEDFIIKIPDIKMNYSTIA